MAIWVLSVTIRARFDYAIDTTHTGVGSRDVRAAILALCHQVKTS